jgi:hypothetical protein
MWDLAGIGGDFSPIRVDLLPIVAAHFSAAHRANRE